MPTPSLTVADDEGNVVSYINSRFAGFGSGLVAGETGIALQNRGSSFSLDPDHPNRLDREPGKRPFHTLIPGLIRFDEDDWAAFGVMGGYMQPQGHVQVVSNLVDYGMPLQQALDEPRWRYRERGASARTPSRRGDRCEAGPEGSRRVDPPAGHVRRRPDRAVSRRCSLGGDRAAEGRERTRVLSLGQTECWPFIRARRTPVTPGSRK